MYAMQRAWCDFCIFLQVTNFSKTTSASCPSLTTWWYCSMPRWSSELWMSTVLFSASSYGFNWARNVRSDLRSCTRNGAPEPARLKIPPLVLLNIVKYFRRNDFAKYQYAWKDWTKDQNDAGFLAKSHQKDAKGILDAQSKKFNDNETSTWFGTLVVSSYAIPWRWSWISDHAWLVHNFVVNKGND